MVEIWLLRLTKGEIKEVAEEKRGGEGGSSKRGGSIADQQYTFNIDLAGSVCD